LNLDAYLPHETSPAPSHEESTKSGEAKKEGGAKHAADAIDFGWLDSLTLDGRVELGSLIASGIKFERFKAEAHAKDGTLRIAPMQAGLYEGSLDGEFSIQAQGNRIHARQKIAGVSIGPLLRDAMDKDLLEGHGNVDFDLTTQGATVAAMKRALQGDAALQLRDGELKGINLAETLRKAKAMLGSKSASEQLAKGGEKTDFSDLSASFVVKQGVAHNDDLLMRSPFLRLTGSGRIDVAAATMDYLAKVTLVNTSTGQGGKSAKDVRSITVPVRASGPIDQLKYKVDLGAMAEGAAKEELNRQLQRQLDRLDGRKRGDQGDTKDQAAPKDNKKKSTEDLLRGLIR